jgi:hypothetical protein
MTGKPAPFVSAPNSTPTLSPCEVERPERVAQRFVSAVTPRKLELDPTNRSGGRRGLPATPIAARPAPLPAPSTSSVCRALSRARLRNAYSAVFDAM